MRLEPLRKPNSTSRKASSLPESGVPGQLPSSDFRTTRPQYEPHTAQSTDTTLPPCRRSTIPWPADPSSQNRCAALTPGHLPRVVRSECWQSEQTRPEALSTNVCPRLPVVGSSGSGRGQGRARLRLQVITRPRPGIQVESKRCLAEPTRAIQ